MALSWAILLGLVEVAAAEVGGVELDAEPVAGELGEAGRAVVVGRGSGRRPRRSGRRSCRGSAPCRLRAVEDLLAVAVDALALVVHHLVVFEQVLAAVEVASPRPSSGPPRCAGVTMLALDGLALLHAEPGEDVARPTRRRRCASGRLRATGRTGCEPGSPCRPARPRSWLSIRRLSCRSVPMMCSPPISATLRPSSFIFSLVLDRRRPDVLRHSSSRARRGRRRRTCRLQLGPGHASRGCRRG